LQWLWHQLDSSQLLQLVRERKFLSRLCSGAPRGPVRGSSNARCQDACDEVSCYGRLSFSHIETEQEVFPEHIAARGFGCEGAR